MTWSTLTAQAAPAAQAAQEPGLSTHRSQQRPAVTLPSAGMGLRLKLMISDYCYIIVVLYYLYFTILIIVVNKNLMALSLGFGRTSG